ncbi:conserved Plasmodium protein, unknown function [Plasmodium ovale]|uniref:Uncharacterized protein n=1 Tax=Plasmodium ovale TaxID=36330 RepID=A0A1D3TKP6_PLAOA|nr:conserved Plasmodium protein, unknown function [Plasmodium ovale]
MVIFEKWHRNSKKCIFSPLWTKDKLKFCSKKREDLPKGSNRTSDDEKTSLNFLTMQEMKLVCGRKTTFSSTFDKRINVFLKPLEIDIIHDRDINRSELVGIDENTREKTQQKSSNCSETGKNVGYNPKYLQVQRYRALKEEKHCYVYDFEVLDISNLGKYEPGSFVNVHFYNKERLGIGMLNRKSNIVIRIIEKDIEKVIDDQFFVKRLYESVKRRFMYIYNISLYDYIHSLNIRNEIMLFCQMVNSFNDYLPGLVVHIFHKSLFIRYDNISIQKYNYIFEKELDKIFSPKNIYCKKISSKKEKRAQGGKEYTLEQTKGNDLELYYSENDLTFYNNITNISYNVFHLQNKQDRLFLQNLCDSSNVLNINGNVGEYIISTCFSQNGGTSNFGNTERVAILLSDCVKNASYAEKNASLNGCHHVMSLHREDLLEELSNMHLNSLRFGLIIFNVKSSITYRRSAYTSEYGKRHTVTFKGVHKYLSCISDILQSNGLLFVTVELAAVDYDKFLNIVRCVFERKKKNLSIVYENSCSIENNIMCNDLNIWHLRSVCFRLGHS